MGFRQESKSGRRSQSRRRSDLPQNSACSNGETGRTRARSSGHRNPPCEESESYTPILPKMPPPPGPTLHICPVYRARAAIPYGSPTPPSARGTRARTDDSSPTASGPWYGSPSGPPGPQTAPSRRRYAGSERHTAQGPNRRPPRPAWRWPECRQQGTPRRRPPNIGVKASSPAGVESRSSMRRTTSHASMRLAPPPITQGPPCRTVAPVLRRTNEHHEPPRRAYGQNPRARSHAVSNVPSHRSSARASNPASPRRASPARSRFPPRSAGTRGPSHHARQLRRDPEPHMRRRAIAQLLEPP